MHAIKRPTALEILRAAEADTSDQTDEEILREIEEESNATTSDELDDPEWEAYVIAECDRRRAGVEAGREACIPADEALIALRTALELE
jgi:hypothetical protein